MYRIGNGYDVHKLVEGRRLILGGVDIPHTMGLLGHSDADVVVHAIMDAMLGALALGDIGQHFPDTGPEYEGADSMKLLAAVMNLIDGKGYKIENIDSQIVAQKPKLKPYIERMRGNISSVLGTEVDRVSVKATTEERLGFTGDESGMKAYAVVLLSIK